MLKDAIMKVSSLNLLFRPLLRPRPSLFLLRLLALTTFAWTGETVVQTISPSGMQPQPLTPMLVLERIPFLSRELFRAGDSIMVGINSRFMILNPGVR